MKRFHYILENMPHPLHKTAFVASVDIFTCVYGYVCVTYGYVCFSTCVWASVIYGSVCVPLWLIGVCVFLCVPFAGLDASVWDYMPMWPVSVSVISVKYPCVGSWLFMWKFKAVGGVTLVLKRQMTLDFPSLFSISFSLVQTSAQSSRLSCLLVH